MTRPGMSMETMIAPNTAGYFTAVFKRQEGRVDKLIISKKYGIEN